MTIKLTVPLIAATLFRKYHHLKCLLDDAFSSESVADQMIPAKYKDAPYV